MAHNPKFKKSGKVQLFLRQEVLEHTERAPVATLYTTASKDFGQARQILETMQVEVEVETYFQLTMSIPGHCARRWGGKSDHHQQNQLCGGLCAGSGLQA